MSENDKKQDEPVAPVLIKCEMRQIMARPDGQFPVGSVHEFDPELAKQLQDQRAAKVLEPEKLSAYFAAKKAEEEKASAKAAGSKAKE